MPLLEFTRDLRYRGSQIVGIAATSTALAIATTDIPSALNAIWIFSLPLMVGGLLNRDAGCLMMALLLSTSVAAVSAVRSFLPFEPPSRPIARAEGSDYQLIIRHWDDPELVWRPFEILLRSDRDPTFEAHILFAEQCEDVTLIQTPRTLHIFYNELALTSFSSMSYGDGPRPILCDLSVDGCKPRRERLIADGAKLIRICPARNADGTPKYATNQTRPPFHTTRPITSTSSRGSSSGA